MKNAYKQKAVGWMIEILSFMNDWVVFVGCSGFATDRSGKFREQKTGRASKSLRY